MFNNVKLSQPSNKIENTTKHSAENIMSHFVNSRPLNVPLSKNQEEIIFGMGCFWGAEKLFWQTKGVITTAVGYIGGNSKNPSYEEVCSGLSGHNEVVRVRFEPNAINPQEAYNIYKEGINSSLAKSLYDKYSMKVSFLEYNKERGSFTI